MSGKKRKKPKEAKKPEAFTEFRIGESEENRKVKIEGKDVAIPTLERKSAKLDEEGLKKRYVQLLRTSAGGYGVRNSSKLQWENVKASPLLLADYTRWKRESGVGQSAQPVEAAAPVAPVAAAEPEEAGAPEAAERAETPEVTGEETEEEFVNPEEALDAELAEAIAQQEAAAAAEAEKQAIGGRRGS